jgi:hypothetical protein
VGLPIESDTDDEEQGKMRSVCMFCLPNNLSGDYRLSRDKGTKVNTKERKIEMPLVKVSRQGQDDNNKKKSMGL